MNKKLSEVIALLDADLARNAVKTRSQSGTSLSYVDTFYVIKRLNECFGNLGWDSETVEMVLVSAPGEKAAYRAKVRITAIVRTEDGEGYMKVVKEGTGWGSDKSMHNAHEMAAKEAESDALKRAAMKFGMSLGLALYDKSQEHVEDEAPRKAAAQAPKPAPAQTVAQKPQTTSDQMAAAQGHPTSVENREALNKKVTAEGRVCIAKHYYTKETFQAMRKARFGVDTTEALTDAQAQALYEELHALGKSGLDPSKFVAPTA